MPETYRIHDNGHRPFKVMITKNKIKIFKHKEYDGEDSDFDEDDLEQYNDLVMEFKNYIQVFVGEDPTNEDFKGNNILIHTREKGKKNTYVLIEGEINSFEIEDQILNFISPVENSDVPYSYAIGKKNIYLTTYGQFISNKDIDKNCNPYDYDSDLYQRYKKKVLHERVC